jgi:heat shock protein HslJ
MIRGNWYLCVVLSALMSGVSGLSLADQNGFPFDSELLLDVRPMPGSKRVPSMDVGANGSVVLELWCNRIEGQLVVAADTITVLTGQATDRQCPPERMRGDADLLTALTGVTNWRRQGDTVMLIGPRTLRFRLPTN